MAFAYTLFLALLSRNATYFEPARSTPEDGPTPTVSIIVPTYNEAEVIGRRLENIAELEFPRDKLQVLVVDSASTDATRDIVRRFAEKHSKEIQVALVEQPARLGKAAAINEAIRQSKADFLVLTDADVTNPRQALSNLLVSFRDSTIGGASGVEIPIGEHTLASRIESGYKAIYTAVRMAESGTDTPFMCESEFSAYRRDALHPLRPGCMCDDIELTVALRSTGLRGTYVSRALFLEQEAGTLKSKLRHKLRRGMANQHAILRCLPVLFDKRFGKYGSIVFPLEFLTHIISPVLVTAGLALLLTILLLAPISGILAIILSLLAAVPPITILYVLTRRYETSRMIGLRGRLDWIAGAAAFLFFQVALVGSLIQLGFRGPKLKWEKISETRTEPPGETGISAPKN